MITGIIERINGSLIRATFTEAPKIGDLVEVGNLKLMGEDSPPRRTDRLLPMLRDHRRYPTRRASKRHRRATHG